MAGGVGGGGGRGGYEAASGAVCLFNIIFAFNKLNIGLYTYFKVQRATLKIDFTKHGIGSRTKDFDCAVVLFYIRKVFFEGHLKVQRLFYSEEMVCTVLSTVFMYSIYK